MCMQGGRADTSSVRNQPKILSRFVQGDRRAALVYQLREAKGRTGFKHLNRSESSGPNYWAKLQRSKYLEQVNRVRGSASGMHLEEAYS